MSLGFLLLSFVSLRVHGAVERVVHAFEMRWAVYGALAVLPVPVVVHLVGYRIDVGVVSLAPVSIPESEYRAFLLQVRLPHDLRQ